MNISVSWLSNPSLALIAGVHAGMVIWKLARLFFVAWKLMMWLLMVSAMPVSVSCKSLQLIPEMSM